MASFFWNEIICLFSCRTPFDFSPFFKMEVKIRLNNTKLGITTVWSLEKFESKLMQMRETYQVMHAFHTLFSIYCI